MIYSCFWHALARVIFYCTRRKIKKINSYICNGFARVPACANKFTISAIS